MLIEENGLGAGAAAKARAPYATQPGTHFPLGSNVVAGGVNFSLFAHDAVAAELRL